MRRHKKQLYTRAFEDALDEAIHPRIKEAMSSVGWNSLGLYEAMREVLRKFRREKKPTLQNSCRHPNAYYYGDTNPPTFKCDDCGITFVKEN